MKLMTALIQKRITVYRLSKLSGVPYMTVNDLVNEVADIKEARFSTVVALAGALGVTCEQLYDNSPYSIPKDKDAFVAMAKQRYLDNGKTTFVRKMLKGDEVGFYLERGKLFEARYLLAFLDYLCREMGLPIAKEYKMLRQIRFRKPIFFGESLSKSEKEELKAKAIPEFLRANIVETDIACVK